MTKHLLFFLFFATATVFSQNNFNKEIRLHSDNDVYSSLTKDRYYTNGAFLSYRFLKPFESEKVAKKIITYSIGQMIYTPYKSTVPDPTKQDRPFAGYLFGEYGIDWFYKKQHSLQTSLHVGVIGPGSKAQEFQHSIHQVYGLEVSEGWEYQIASAVAINLNATYIHFLGADSSKRFDISSVSSLRAGTVFTDMSTGVYTRIGFKPLQELFNTTGLRSNLNDANTNYGTHKETFLFFKYILNYVVYDATIQGSFLNDNSPVTFDVMPFYSDLEIGFKNIVNRLSFGYSIHIHSKKLRSQQVKNSNVYGSIQLSYIFN